MLTTEVVFPCILLSLLRARPFDHQRNGPRSLSKPAKELGRQRCGSTRPSKNTSRPDGGTERRDTRTTSQGDCLNAPHVDYVPLGLPRRSRPCRANDVAEQIKALKGNRVAGTELLGSIRCTLLGVASLGHACDQDTSQRGSKCLRGESSIRAMRETTGLSCLTA